MLATLHAYLAHQPPGQTTFLLAFGPGFVMMLAGFAWTHVRDVRASR